MRFIVLFFIGILQFAVAFAQNHTPVELRRWDVPFDNPTPRTDDHMWRLKILRRIDLEEKENKPLKKAESRLFLDTEGDYPFSPDAASEENAFASYKTKKGIVYAIIDAFKNHVITHGYDPDNLTREISWEEFDSKVTSLTNAEAPKADEKAEEGGDEEGDDFGGEEEEDSEPAANDVLATPNKDDFDEKYAYLNAMIELLEDRVFEKNKSDIYHDLQYIRLTWVDITLGGLPDKNVIAFAYDSTMRKVLENTQWSQRADGSWNDAENRSVREILEERIYNSFNIEISRNEIRTLKEGEIRNQQMLEFEHSLWSY